MLLSLSSELSLKVYGIDVSEVAVEAAQKKSPNAEIVCGMAEQLPWENDVFDYVACLGSLRYFQQPEKAVTEMARVLKPDGVACIAIHNTYFIGYTLKAWLFGQSHDPAGGYYLERFGTQKGWQSLLETGFRVVKTFRHNSRLSSPEVSPKLLALYNVLIRPLVPLNLSQGFIFVLKKSPSIKAT